MLNRRADTLRIEILGSAAGELVFLGFAYDGSSVEEGSRSYLEAFGEPPRNDQDLEIGMLIFLGLFP